MDTHNGVCSFCHTKVPTSAVICTGCGARWGTKSGHSRNEIRASGVWLLAIAAIIFGVDVYFQLPGKLFWLVAFFSAIFAIPGLMNLLLPLKFGWRRERRA